MTDTNIPIDAPSTAPGPGINVRVNPNDSVQHREQSVVNLSDLGPARPGVLATVKRAGSPVLSGPLLDSDVINVTLPSGAATTMSLRQAKFAGLVQTDEKDGYVLKSAEAPNEQRKAPPEGSPESAAESAPYG